MPKAHAGRELSCSSASPWVLLGPEGPSQPEKELSPGSLGIWSPGGPGSPRGTISQLELEVP